MKEILLGELDGKSGKGRGLGRDAYYFENESKGEALFLKSFLFKVNKVKYRTRAYVRFYKKKEYTEEVYLDAGTVTYPSFIPGDEIQVNDIVIYIESGQKGVIDIDLSKYDIPMPAEGLFVSLEGDGYFDDKGDKVTRLKPKDATVIDFHPSVTDNYCGTAIVQGREDLFWINSNKRLRTDFKYAFKKEAPEKMLVAPNFGLKVGHR